jgi:hypothetical protein
MAVGLPLKTTYANGDVYSASDVNDTNGTINITAAPYAAGKNKIINGDFSVNARAFTSTSTSATYGFDRWRWEFSSGTNTYSSQAFTAGTAPVSGYEGTNFARIATTGQSATNAYTAFNQRMEDVRTFAGQTVTVSFWAKANSGTPKVSLEIIQVFGIGGSGDVNTQASSAFTLSTSWQRFSTTIAIPSISGKTIGANSFLGLFIWTSAGSDFNSRTNSIGVQNATIDFWGVQVENGSTATAFQTATGNIEGELAACQRYFQVICDGAYEGGMQIGSGVFYNSTVAEVPVRFPVQLRGTPSMTFSAVGDFRITQGGSTYRTVTALTTYNQTPLSINISPTASTSTATAGAATLFTANNTSAKLYMSAEL